MAGLLGMDEDMQMALLASLLGAASASGVRPGTALARGGLLGMNVYQNQKAGRAEGQRQARDDEFRQWQMDEARRKAAEAERMQAGYAEAARNAMNPGMPAGLGTVDSGMDAGVQPAVPPSFDPQKFAMGLMPYNPVEAAKMLTPKAQDSPYDKIDPSKYTPESLSLFERTRNPSVLRPAQKAQEMPVSKISPSDFTPQSVQAFIASGGTDYNLLKPIDKRPVTSNTIINAGETEFNKTLGKKNAEAYAAMMDSARAAGSKINNLAAVESLIGDVETSSATPIGMKAAGYAKAIGLDLDANLPRKQAAEIISNKMALDARNTAEGGGMPGAMSDADREFLKAMTPNVAQTREGRKLVTEVHRRIAKREQQVAQLARNYRSKNQRFDEGFYDELAQWSAANPLFADLQTNAGNGGTGRITIKRLP